MSAAFVIRILESFGFFSAQKMVKYHSALTCLLIFPDKKSNDHRILAEKAVDSSANCDPDFNIRAGSDFNAF